MKVPERIRATHLILAGLPLLFLAGWSGDVAGRARAASLNGKERGGVIAEESVSLRTEADGKGAVSGNALDLEKKLSQVLRAWAESPNGDYDFELAAEVERMMSGLTSDDFRSLYEGSAKRLPFRQRFELLAAWAAVDAPGALAAIDDGERGKTIAIGLYREWMLRDPDAALNWLNDGGASPELKERAKTLRLNALLGLVEADPDAALAQISKMDRAEAVQNLRTWMVSSSLSEAMRKQVLETATSLATPEELVGIQKTQAFKMAEKDPAGAMALADSLELSEKERLGLEAQVHFARKDVPVTKALDEWMAIHGDDAEVPGEVQVKISTMMFQQREEADRWLAGLPAGPQRDLIYEKAVRNYLGFDRPQEAVGLLAGIESEASRAAALRMLDRLWPQKDANAASAWREGLSEEDQALLEE